jgi:hypothetical protein
MTDKKLDSRQLRAVRLIRAGSPVEQVCKTLRLPVASVRSLETACRDVPDDILERLERALSDNEKLRRLVAGLVGPMLADDPAGGHG